MTAPTPVLTDPPTDYTTVIRDEIAREVQRLSDAMWRQPVYDECGNQSRVYRRPVAVRLGYLTNTHRGQSVFAEGELIAGLPVKTCRQYFHRITVEAHTGLPQHNEWSRW